MRMEALDNPRLKKLLSKLLDPEFKVKNETYLNGLIDHIKDSQGECIHIYYYCIIYKYTDRTYLLTSS